MNKCKLFSKPDGTVYGKVCKTEFGSFKAYWTVPMGYFSGGTDLLIGEYATQDIAINNMQRWIENKWEEQRLSKARISKENKKWYHLFCKKN